MSKSKITIWLPSVATILAAIISAYATFSVNKVTSEVDSVTSTVSEIQRTDIGTLGKGQKLCVVAKTGVWHNITVVSKEWTISMCSKLGKPFESDAFFLGCAFTNNNVFSGKNVPEPPAQNCGW